MRTADGQWLYPAWQFTGGGGIHPVLVPVLKALRGLDRWAAGVWLVAAHPDLSGSSPRQALRDGADRSFPAPDRRRPVVPRPRRPRRARPRLLVVLVGRPGRRSGRVWSFDLPTPDGTCYLASTEEAAARERVGTQLRNVSGHESVLAAALTTPQGPVTVSETEVPTRRAANLSVNQAQRWVDRSLSVGTGIYAVTQVWAAALRAAGFGGIVHEPRFTGGARVRSLAVFGRAVGPRPVPQVVRTRALRVVLETHAVRVVDPPASAPAVLSADATPPPL